VQQKRRFKSIAFETRKSLYLVITLGIIAPFRTGVHSVFLGSCVEWLWSRFGKAHTFFGHFHRRKNGRLNFAPKVHHPSKVVAT